MMTSTPNFFHSTTRKLRRRSGVTPVISTTILIAITVTLGLALWSYSNSQVNTSTETFVNEVTDYVNYVNDRFVIVNFAFGHDAVNQPLPFDRCQTDTHCLSVWIYNYGNTPVTIEKYILSSNSSPPLTDEMKTSLPLVIAPKSMGVFVIDNSSGFTPGTTYYVKVISSTGAQQSFFQGAG